VLVSAMEAVVWDLDGSVSDRRKFGNIWIFPLTQLKQRPALRQF